MGYFLRPIDLPAEYPGTTTRNEEDRSEEQPSYLKTAGGKGLPRNPGHHRG